MAIRIVIKSMIGMGSSSVNSWSNDASWNNWGRSAQSPAQDKPSTKSSGATETAAIEQVGTASSGSPDLLAARKSIIDNFGFIDAASPGSAHDGCVTRQDISQASAAGALVSLEAQLLAAVANDRALFDKFDARDGCIDGNIYFWAMQKGQGDEDYYLHDAGYEVPQAFDAHYNDDFYTMMSGGTTGSGRSLDTLPESNTAVRAALDGIDGHADGNIDLDAIKMAGAQDAQILEAPANNGSGQSVLQAGFNALLEDYGKITVKREEASPEDLKRLDFLMAVTAKGAIDGGIPMDKGSNGVTEDVPGEFVRDNVLDAAKVEEAYNRLLGDSTIQADLAVKVRALTPDLSLKINLIKDRLMSTAYAGHLHALEKQGKAAEANALMTQDIAALRMLDEQAAQQASEGLLTNMAHATIDESNFTNIPQGSAVQAIYDIFQVTGPLKAGRVGMRVTGQIATLITSLDQIKSELASVKGGLEKLSSNLASLFKITQQAGGDIADSGRLMSVLDSVEATQQLTEADRSGLKKLIIQMDKVGAWQMGAAVFGIAGGIYRLAVPGSHPWDRLYAAQEFLASASYTTGPAKAFAQFLEARAGDSASKFNAAMKKPLLDLVKLSQAGTLETSVPDMPELGRPSTTSIASTIGSEVPDPASIDLPVEIATKHRLTAAFVKGFAAITEVGSGVIGVALGAKMIAEGIQSGSGAEKAVGSLSLISGVSTVVGAALSVVFAAGTPFLIFGGAVAIIGLLVTVFTGKSYDASFADGLEERWKDTGFLREGWRDPTEAWWREHANTERLSMDL